MASAAHNRPRVVQITHDLGVGGLPRVVEMLCNHLDPDRFEVEVLCLHEGGPLMDRLSEGGIQSFVLDRPGTRSRGDYLATFRIARHLRRRAPDIVHTHNTEPFVEGGFAAVLAQVPALVHTDHAREFPDKWRYMFAERVMSHFADAVVAVSDHGKENLRKYVKVPEKKLVTILNGVDGEIPKEEVDPDEVRASLGVPIDAPLIGLGARFEEQKGIKYLLRGMPTVLERHPDAHLVLAGYGPEEELLKSEAESLEITHRVRFIGKVDSMDPVLACLDIFALPSIWEGLPMAILEAMAARVPIVATDVGGVGSALEDRKTAILVPPRQPEAFAQGLITLLDAPELGQELSTAARTLFDERFSAETMAQNYADLYERALGGS